MSLDNNVYSGDTHKSSHSFSLKGRLVVLLLVTVLPFIMFSIYKAVDNRDRLQNEAKRESLTLAKTVSHEVDEYLIATGEILIPIAKQKDVRTQNFTATKAWLDEVLEKYPYYHLIAFVDMDGYVKTASMTEAMAKSEDAKNIKLSVKDTACYKRGIVSDGMSIGDFMYSKITGMPVVHVTYPVFDYSGKRIGFMAVAFDLTKVQERLMNFNIPEHTAVTILDDRGIVIARSKNPEKWVGRDLSNQMDIKKMLSLTEGTGKTKNLEGSTRLFGFAATSNAPWYVRVSVDYEFILSQARAELINHFAVFVPLLLIAIFGWLWTGRGVDKLHKETTHMSLIDPLTGLWNCRKLHYDFDINLSRAKRYREDLSFAMLDIDYFKQYNDHNGHQLGDEALRIVTGIIRNAVREVDSVYRYGGEEFSVLLPATDKVGAFAVAERIREEVERTVFTGGENQPTSKLTISIGIATFPYDSIAKESLIRCADVALYSAKNGGRNTVESFTGDNPNSENSPSSFSA